MNLIPRRILDVRQIKKRALINFIFYILLLLPDDFYRIFTIYSSTTPSYIQYKWLNYSFNIIHLIILIWGILIAILCYDRFLFGMASLMAVREIVFLIWGYNSCFTNSSYEIYLTLFTGVALLKLVENNCRSVLDLEYFYWKSIFLNVLTVFVAPILGAGIFSGTYSRFNAVNMDVGSTGTICAMLIILSCYNKTVKNQVLIAGIAIIALFLSGSRVNLLLLFLILIIGAAICARRDCKISKKWFYVIVGGTIVGTIGVLFVLMMNRSMTFGESTGVGRMLSAFSFNKMENDGSVLGRTTSIIAGLDIIKDNPLGISGYFINLQNETIKRGFPTFPHSSLIDYYILLGPIVIGLIVRLFLCLKRLYISNQIVQFLVLIYLILFVTFSGGPIINFKIIFFYATLFRISVLKESERDQLSY